MGHICDFCGRKFKTKLSFEVHVDEHKGIYRKPAQCAICKEWVANESCLRMHNKRKHADDANIPSSCHICGSWHETKASLQYHIRYTHNLKKDFKCNLCDKTFKLKINLKVCIKSML